MTIYKKVCEICGQPFDSTKWYARTDKDSCRMALSRKEKAEREQAQQKQPQPAAKA